MLCYWMGENGYVAEVALRTSWGVLVVVARDQANWGGER